MTTLKTDYKYIEVNERSDLVISGTRMKVIELVTSVKAYGWSPEELGFQYPHLTMSQIYSALAYYWDHREDMDRQIEQRFQQAEEKRIKAGESPFAARLREKSLLQ